MTRAFALALLLVPACAAPRAGEPSLAPRAAEAVDPRVPIPSEVVSGPADPALVSRIAALLAEIAAGSGAFRAAAEHAERLAAAAGPAESESWIVAQEALSAVVAARAPVTRAIADLDALASERIERSGGILPGDLAAIQAATAQAADVGQRQAEAIDRLQARLGA